LQFGNLYDWDKAAGKFIVSKTHPKIDGELKNIEEMRLFINPLWILKR